MGRECFCSTSSYNQYGKVDDSECDKVYQDNTSENGRNANRNSIYRISGKNTVAALRNIVYSLRSPCRLFVCYSFCTQQPQV